MVKLFTCLLAGFVLSACCPLGNALGQDSEPGAAEVATDHDVDGDGDHGEDHESSGAGHEGDHVDNDPTHANMSDASYSVTEFRTDMAFFSGIVFLLLLAGLGATAWKPIMEGLQKREDSIAANIADAEKSSEAASAKLAEYESKLATANEEAATIVSDARKDAEAAGQKLVAAAQEDAVRIKDRATADIESAKRVALGELAEQSTEVAMSVAKSVVGREVNANDHQSLIQEMLSKLPSKN
ncbi:MAG: F0F1 ATP synthase subunit B [Pirellulaceae bacterium]